jgi:hypothetical protein
MSRFILIVIVVLLGAAPLGGARAFADTEAVGGFTVGVNDDVPWQQVSRPEPVKQEDPNGGGVMTIGERPLTYQVYFNQAYAAVPVIPDAEYMTIIVAGGTFALDLRDVEHLPTEMRNFVVDPADGHPIPLMKFVGDAAGYYQPIDGLYVQSGGADCTSMCIVKPGKIVQVQTGDKITAPSKGICIWCLLNSQGLLLVSPVLDQSKHAEDFTWLVSWEKNQGASATVGAAATPTRLSWAFFNPGPGCHRGPG